jgi:hypothetical protein
LNGSAAAAEAAACSMLRLDAGDAKHRISELAAEDKTKVTKQRMRNGIH